MTEAKLLFHALAILPDKRKEKQSEQRYRKTIVVEELTHKFSPLIKMINNRDSLFFLK